MPNGLTMLTVLIVVGSTEAATITKTGKFAIKPVVGGFVLGIFLFVIASINDDLATKFNALVIIAALLINGNAVATALGKAA